MEIIITKDYQEMSRKAFEIFKEAIESNPKIVLGLATGSTPKGLYKELVNAYKEGEIDFSQVKTFNLDEYVGLSKDDIGSYNHFMREHLFDHVNIKKENIFIPDGKAEDLEAHCKEYDDLIRQNGGIDLQLLGIGEDGHIAFNEPGEFLHINTHISQLAPSTIEVNSRFFNSIEEVPRTAISLGMGEIMKAKKIVLLANGKRKRKVIKKLLNEDKVTTELPVSFLLTHPNVTVIVDEEAYNGGK